MQTSTNNNQDWIDAHQASHMPGQHLAWLTALRHTAIQRFNQVGLPGIRDEEWRYTNLRALKSNVYAVSPFPTANLELTKASGTRLVFVNGRYSAADSSIETNSGVELMSLAEILESAPSDNNNNFLERYFGSTLPKKPHGFTALNTANCQDGYVLRLSKNQQLLSNIEILFINGKGNEATDLPAISYVRNLIIAEANSECRIIERHIGNDGQIYLNNCITEIIAADNAHVDHYKVQQESNDAFHIGAVFISQDTNAQIKSHNIALTGLVTRNDIVASLNGQGAHIEMNGLVIGDGRQHVDNHTEVKHAVANCSSDEYYKTILDGHARSVFRGRIIVAQDAQLSNAGQQNNNLLLSKNAEADTKPQLEIYADDVKCSHGATVGQLDPKSLFYLYSRGIDKKSARALLTFAFANEVIERIKIDTLRQELTELIAGQLLS